MWQRFTERARRIIILSQEEARNMKSTAVGPEHLLLGLMREDEGVAAQVLQKAGVSPQGVRQEIEAAPMPEAAPALKPTSEPKLSSQAKRVLELSADEGRRMRHDYIGTEHILLAILRQPETLAASVLKNLGLNLEEARKQVLEYTEPEQKTAGDITVEERAADHDIGMPRQRADQHVVTHSHYSFEVTPQAQLILSLAFEQAKQRNQGKVDVGHILLALFEAGSIGMVSRMLTDLGVDAASARRWVQENLKSLDF